MSMLIEVNATYRSAMGSEVRILRRERKFDGGRTFDFVGDDAGTHRRYTADGECLNGDEYALVAAIDGSAVTTQRGQKDEPGRKDDTGKDPWNLLPWDAARAIVKVLAFGATKYDKRNWERGMDWSRPFDACMRHLTSWWEGEKADPETGYSHLWHAGACICFLISYEIRARGQDDRP